MEWIEVSARTLDDARELALDRLGVVADELEYEVIDEPRGGLFGIGRTEARIRARVKPLSREKPTDRTPPPIERAPPERRWPQAAGRRLRESRRRRGSTCACEPRTAPSRPSAPTAHAPRRRLDFSPAVLVLAAAPSRSGRQRRRCRTAGSASRRAKPRTQGNDDRPEAKVNVDTDAEDVDVEAQAERAADFTRSLVEAMGLTGSGELAGR